MMQLITPENYAQFTDALANMHCLRFRVFKERLDWAVHAENGMERDRFDKLEPVYLLHSGNDHRIQGCVRLLPSTGPNMLRDVFPQLLGGNPCPSDPRIWESSRFALELSPAMPRTENGLAKATFELFAGMIEFGLSRSLTGIMTVTDLRMERILRRANWPLERLGDAGMVGATPAVAGTLEVSLGALARTKQACGIEDRVLWAPVPLAAA
ncbi:MAG: autoinducer synthesis protein [Fimbriimonadaceae bacterium]|nr:autoinducer synthesis protein [Alphaproteobacteria bacterium]